MKNLILLAMLLSVTLFTQAAGFQRSIVASAHGKPLTIGIWYPSKAIPKLASMGPISMSVAVDGAVDGRRLPLIVMSHGTGGSFLDNRDTAIALADAGFVVVAVTHTGDNYEDQSRSTFIMDRPSQISNVITHMLANWDVLDPARIGMFGFSAGGFTTLVAIGGIADFSKISPTCRDHPRDFPCQLMAKAPTGIAMPDTRDVQDQRIKAAVVVAPALGFTFAPDGLKGVRIPVQLWRAENDVVLPHPRYAEAVRMALPQAPDLHVVPNAGHFDFLAPCSAALAKIAPAICESAPGFDRTAFHQIFDTAVVDFFGTNLN
ncbi:dienelactone hydrolase [Duganella sp. FT109W]|uniref:Dienelactone hydrolase n=1 Tax=Duganella margarita TaxID=2692170 RepID=A0ABW9WRW8_9BURK|nr:dienelactone hydrolase [Duganella margarita]MYN42920.1 dienelactone hydrolase [Duganella margarita]